jgi:hypothetical protein
MDLVALGAFIVLVVAWVVLPLRAPAVETLVELDKAA